jgi:hypothetical protein
MTSDCAEHENPGEATVQVFHGRFTIAAGEESVQNEEPYK